MNQTLIIALFSSLPLFMLSNDAAQATGVKRALLVCGLTGDEEFKEQFVESVSQIRSNLVDRFGFDESNVRIHFGRGDSEQPPEEFANAGSATREEIVADVRQLVADVKESDSTWVFLIGHAYFDGKTSFFNIPDKDITHQQFGELFQNLAGPSTFFICTPVSGYYIKGLSKPNRVIITATAADMETNGSIFHTALAQAMTSINDQPESDLDKDGTVSVLDLYIKATQNLSDLYLNDDPPLIATEHPLLDDNGDGRGSELQIDYLTMAQGGRSDSKRRRKIKKFKDGKSAAKRLLDIH